MCADGQSVYGHKNILVNRCKYMVKLLNGEFSEAGLVSAEDAIKGAVDKLTSFILDGDDEDDSGPSVEA